MKFARAYNNPTGWPSRAGGSGYMGISIGSRNHTGGCLLQTVNWVNDISGFNKIRIGLSDTLNRFTIMTDKVLSEGEARQECIAQGDVWLKDNRSVIERLKIPHEIIRWDYWESTRPDAVVKNRQCYKRAFFENPVFREAVLTDMDNFSMRRYGIPLSKIDMSTGQKFLDYLIEELAVYEEIYRDYPNTTIYPGKQLECARVLREGLLPGLSETFQHTKFERLRVSNDIIASQSTRKIA